MGFVGRLQQMAKFELNELLNQSGLAVYHKMQKIGFVFSNDNDENIYNAIQDYQNGNADNIDDLLIKLYKVGWLHHNFRKVEWLKKNYNNTDWIKIFESPSKNSNSFGLGFNVFKNDKDITDESSINEGINSNKGSKSNNEETLGGIKNYADNKENKSITQLLLKALATEYARIMVEGSIARHIKEKEEKFSERQLKLNAIERMAEAANSDRLIDTNDLAILYTGGSDARKHIGNKIGVGGQSYRNIYSLAESYQVEVRLNGQPDNTFNFNEIEKNSDYDNYQKKLLETVKWAYEKDIKKQFRIDSQKSVEGEGSKNEVNFNILVAPENTNASDTSKMHEESSDSSTHKEHSINHGFNDQPGREKGNIFTQLADKIANKKEITDEDKKALYAKYPERTEALYLKKNLDKQVDNYNKYSIGYKENYINELNTQRSRIAEKDAGGIGFLTKNNIAYQRVQMLEQLIKDVASYNISNSDASKSPFQSVVSKYKLNEKQTHWSANNTTTYNTLKKPLIDFLNKSQDIRAQLNVQKWVREALTKNKSLEQSSGEFNRYEAIKQFENNDRGLSNAKITLIKTIDAEIERLKETSSYMQAEGKINSITEKINNLDTRLNIDDKMFEKINESRYSKDNFVERFIGATKHYIKKALGINTTAGASISGYYDARKGMTCESE